jgi:glycosyltransferase involved in cell wall biosynthesis
MKIWFINHYALPPSEAGGTRHYSHARELISRGHEVTIVASSFHHLQRKHMMAMPGNKWERQEFDGVPFIFIPSRGYQSNSLARVVNMVEFAHRTWQGRWTGELTAPDLILGSSPDPFAALAAERLASWYSVPFVLEIRDLWPYVLTEVGGYSRLHPFVLFVARLMRYLYARAGKIIMFSQYSGDLMTRYGADPRKIVWIPNGVDLSMSPEPRPAPDDGPFIVTYLGAHNQWNSLDAVLDAAKILQGRSTRVTFRFIGDGVSKPGLIEKAKTEGIRNVSFDDPVPKKKVPEVLNSSHAFIINNRKDGASKGWMSFQKIYEYLAAARPVVFGSCTNDDVVRESGAGISVEAGNATQLAAAVEILAGMSPDQRWEYGLRGRRYIENGYSISSLAARFEGMARELTGQKTESSRVLGAGPHLESVPSTLEEGRRE